MFSKAVWSGGIQTAVGQGDSHPNGLSCTGSSLESCCDIMIVAIDGEIEESSTKEHVEVKDSMHKPVKRKLQVV